MQIFMSYAREDEAFVSQLADALQQTGAGVWLDMRNAPQDDRDEWQVAVDNALAESDILLLVANENALQQEYISHDWNMFIEARRPVVVALTSPCPNLPEPLRQRNPVDFSYDFDAAFHRLSMLLLEKASQVTSKQSSAVQSSMANEISRHKEHEEED